MKHTLLELMDLPGQVLGAVGVMFASMVTAVLTLLAQFPPAAANVVSEAPTWFLAFGAFVVIALAWACLTIARFAAVTQIASNNSVKDSMEQQTKVLTKLTEIIDRQNRFWESAGMQAITRNMDAELPCEMSSAASVLHARPMRPRQSQDE